MIDRPVHFGPFRVEERIGEGGMGVVYRGEHRGTGVPVAVKVIRAYADEGALRRFHGEVRAHARLQHPGVVYLFEYGEVDGEAARRTGGELQAGVPYVAMELADRGTVRDAMPLEDWEAVCRLLVQVLDTLAHAHARGVVHRDLKPENFLVFRGEGDANLDRRIKLADFGIAHALGTERDAETDDLESAAGTPHYMAPEQARGRWREFGPWTDLYAVGCITWELVCGRPPYTGTSPFDILAQHAAGAPPPLDPNFPVPEGLANWVRRAMSADPEARFRRAADAAWALPTEVLADTFRADNADAPSARAYETGPDSTLEQHATTERNSVAPTLPLDRPDAWARTETMAERTTAESPGGVEASRDSDDVSPDPMALLEGGHPPLPEEWRPVETESLPAPLVGAGLGLFGLRDPPFVNRVDEGDRIWERLEDVVAEASCRMVFVAGEAGTGKSRLAGWMATRAHEVGAVRVLRARHTRSGGPSEGLEGALEAFLRTVKLGRSEVFERLRARLPALEAYGGEWIERDARALTEFLRPTDDEAEEVDGPRYRFANADQKRALLMRVMRRLADRRPLLLWVDDLQWAEEALGLLERLVDASSDSPPLLVVATVRSDLVRDLPRVERRLERLEASSRSTSVRLDPLAGDDQRALVEGLLPLDDELAELLAERTEGRPLFAMQLLAHWIESGELVVGPDGFDVPEGEALELPEGIHELWMERVDRLAGAVSTGDRATVVEALERAAALGRDVDGDEWRALCEAFEGVSAGRLRDALVERGLAESTDQGWAFTHGLFVDSLERHAREAGRWREHHRACAELIDALYRDRPRETGARRADHWIEAGELERALDPLFEEANQKGRRGEFRAAEQVLQRRAGLFEELGIPPDDRRRIEHDSKLAIVDLRLGEAPDEVREMYESVRRRAEREGYPELVATALRGLAMCRRPMGDGKTARDRARAAAQRAEETEDHEKIVATLLTWGWMEYFLGRYEVAEERFDEARRRAAEQGEDYLRLHATSGLAWSAIIESNWDRASRWFEESLRECETLGYYSHAAKCLSGLADIARFRGDADEARRRYRRAREMSRVLQSPSDEALTHLNLASVELMAGQFEEAREYLSSAERKLEWLSRGEQYEELLRVCRVVYAAGTEDWSTFDELVEHYCDGWPEGASVMRDHPWLLEMAGDYAADRGERSRARRVWRLARGLWGRLEDDDAERRIDDKLGG